MISSLEESQTGRVKTLIIRTGKEIVRNMFDVNVVKLMEDSGRDRKYGIGPVIGYGAMGGRVCDRPKISLI